MLTEHVHKDQAAFNYLYRLITARRRPKEEGRRPELYIGEASGETEGPSEYILRDQNKKQLFKGDFESVKLWLLAIPLVPKSASGQRKHIGEIEWFDADKGYGFLRPDEGGNHIFVHCSNVLSTGRSSATGQGTLMAGDRVQYSIGPGRGEREDQAIDVEALEIPGLE